MGKYKTVEKHIFTIFSSPAWIASGIKTVPSNFNISATEYIRVNILATGNGANTKSVSGQLIIDIFTKAGEGPSRSAEIADILDAFLELKSFEGAAGVTQTMVSTYAPGAVDTANSSLFRSKYNINFNFFGVQ